MKVKFTHRYALHYTSDAHRTARQMNLDLRPWNYEAVPVLTFDRQQAVLVQGKDVGQWTLDDYILPLLNERYATSEVDHNTVRQMWAV